MRDTEEQLVRELGERIGHGRLMHVAEHLWREKARSSGLQGTELTIGPRGRDLVPCPCSEGAVRHCGCDWCCGTTRVTKRVTAAIGMPGISGGGAA